ncbi:hypothetical protein M0805_009855 [Coniferiporia weirii]|nr:hypothetical protein M0805_009855 [Coniferiporia weirii]
MCPTQVPSLKCVDSTFTKSDTEKGLRPLPPPPLGTLPLLMLELMDVLAGTSNLSAPGPLGIGYHPLKWVIAAFPNEILTLFNDCLHLGHHPKCWWAAKVVMLWKPNKKDPFSPHSYRPITLEETLGKLLEKMIANQLQFLTNEEDWLPPNQYGRRQGHSVYDAAQHLLQLAEGAHSTNQVCSILTVDIQGFFNSVHPQLLHQQLLTMGCLPNMVDWCLSFMTRCKVAISFDGTTTPLSLKPNLSTPQGSPTSPILSTIFTGLVLHCFQWRGCKLLAYVNDHLIVCVGASVTANCKMLADAYHHLNSLFNRLGLNIEAAKTEALHFHPPCRKIGYHGWDMMGIQIDDHTLVWPSIPLCWLGIWWDPGLSFKPHVECMHSKGLSTLAALRILGNTECGISALHLWQLYSACVCTVLAWGAPVWYHGRAQKTLAHVPHVQQVPMYMHPPWVDPLAFRQGWINFSIPPVPVPSEVFTNGSHLGQKAGSAIIAMCRPYWLCSHRLTSPWCTTATDAEQFSLGVAPGWAACHLHEELVQVTDIVFMSDSLTALNLYRVWPSLSGANLLPLWKAGMQTLLNTFPHLSLHFVWSPSHEDIAGNEWADQEAKAATSLPPSNLPPSISMLKEQATLTAHAQEDPHSPG